MSSSDWINYLQSKAEQCEDLEIAAILIAGAEKIKRLVDKTTYYPDSEDAAE